jgi:hypothetical protein
MRPTVSILTTGVGPNQASGVGPVPLDKPSLGEHELVQTTWPIAGRSWTP